MRRGVLLVLLGAFVACKKAEQKPDYSQCRFDFDPGAAKLEWKAYKFTERLGVSGTFNTIRTGGTAVAETPELVFRNATFEIDSLSVNTNNPDRDKKIAEAFFKGMKEPGKITAKVVSVSGDRAALRLRLNGVEKDIEATLRRDGKDLEVNFRIDVADFKALGPLAALNKVCLELHKGKDGKSKLWPDVDVRITAALKPLC
ncbi:MAG: YceI family protein [Turneriella sp.]|nr:YceI family protein [Turneriella sp.]